MSMTGKFELHTLLLMNEFRKFPEIGVFHKTKPRYCVGIAAGQRGIIESFPEATRSRF
jgi:hypothetical protein